MSAEPRVPVVEGWEMADADLQDAAAQNALRLALEARAAGRMDAACNLAQQARNYLLQARSLRERVAAAGGGR